MPPLATRAPASGADAAAALRFLAATVGLLLFGVFVPRQGLHRRGHQAVQVLALLGGHEAGPRFGEALHR